MPSAATTTAQSAKAAERQQIFDAPSSSLPKPPDLPPIPPVANGTMDIDKQPEEVKGMKRGRDEESDEEVDMEEDSDAPMEEASDDDDDD